MKRILHLLILLLSLSTLAVSQVSTPPSSGDGTVDNPYQIASLENLYWISENSARWGHHYIQTADIDASSTSTWNSGAGWSPIGNATTKFTGAYYGNGKIISNLYINRSGTDYQGLFGYINEGVVYGLGMENANIYGKNYVGAISGYTMGTYIIFACYSTGSIRASNYAGGLVGYHIKGNITSCYSHAQVQGASYVGGLTGFMGSASYVASIFNTYSTGAVSGSGSYIGGFIGRYYNGDVVDCYWDTITSGQTTSGSGTPKNTSQMMQKATYIYYNFYTLWTIDEGNAYPEFQDISLYDLPQAVVLSSLSGTGTPADPYIITSPDELNAISQDMAASYKLGNDIDMAASVIWNYGQGWLPVGVNTTPFTGSLDGNGYAISNLSVNRASSDYQGLFGYVQNNTFNNIMLEDFSILGKSYVGAFCGYSNNCIIDKITINAMITSTVDYAGGVAGMLYSGIIHRATININLNALGNYSGGICGYIDNYAFVYHSQITGSIYGDRYSGGITGHNRRGTITDCFNHASINCDYYAGGIAGYTGNSSSSYYGNILRSFSSGAVTDGTNCGGLLGLYSFGSVYDCYWDTQTSGRSTSAKGIAKTTAEMQDSTTFDKFNFNTLWTINQGSSYPYFKNLDVYNQPQDVNLSSLSGTGTVNDPYIITTADELNAMRQDLAASYKLGASIDMAATTVWNNGQGWQAVGDNTNKFTGNFDGNGYTISNICINRPSTDYQGLFGYTQSDTLTDIKFDKFNIQARSYVASLTGYANTSIIENVELNCVIISQKDYCGSITGYVNGGVIHRIKADINIDGKDNYTGGIAGFIENYCFIQSCEINGSINGVSYAGGVTGRNYRGHINDCKNAASINGTEYIGGISGHNGNSASSLYGNIYRSFNVGSVNGTSNVGGLIGSHSFGKVIASYWDTESSGQASSGGGTAKTTDEMQHQISFENYNFNTLWAIDEGSSYPYLKDLTLYSQPATLDLSSLTGSGTPADPYLITNADELNTIRQDLSASYKLSNDIDLSSTSVWNYGKGWLPIGNSTDKFTGHLDGNAYTINNLTINRSEESYVGLFGYSQNGTIKNINFENANIFGNDYVATISAYANTNSIYNSTIKAQITSNGTYVGTAIGYISNSKLSRINAEIYLTGLENYYGGIAGYATATSLIQTSSVRGYIKGGSYIGGVTGQNHNGTISDCYSHAEVCGTDYIGGLVGRTGYASSNYNGNILNSFSTGIVSATGLNVGGLLGSYSLGRIRYAFWDSETSGRATSAGGTSKTSNELKQQTTFVNYNFNTLWQVDAGNDYPEFQDFSSYEEPQTIVLSNLSGSGVLGDPYLITNIHELNAMRQDLSAYYKLANDIDMSDCVIWNNGQGWEAVGNNATKFTGNFDGDNYKLTNFYTNYPLSNYQGLFGYISAGQVKNLSFENASVNGYDYVGVICGYLENSIVEDIQIGVEINGHNNYLGCIAGYAKGASIARVSVDSRAIGYGNSVGSVAGQVRENTTIDGSFAKGSVEGVDYVAGLVGYLYGGTLSNSYTKTQVNGDGEVGGAVGLAGYYSSSINGNITNCYSIGIVSGNTYTGGLLGRLSKGTTTESYWDTITSAISVSAAGTGHNSTVLKDESNFLGWDFTNTWSINSNINSGYPYLQWQTFPAEPMVETADATDITKNTATGNGAVINFGNSTPTQHGICWNTTGNPTTADNKTEEGAVSQPYSYTSALTGLNPSTIYFVRAYAINNEGTAYGEQLSFCTLPIESIEPAGTGEESDPYLIASLENLYWLSQNNSKWDKHYKQTAAINASESSYWNGGRGWSPIGNNSVKFTGAYDGQDYAIDSLYIDRTGADYQGFFGYANGADFSNINLTKVNISGWKTNGGMIARAENSTIDNCSVNGSVYGTENIGGIIGYLLNSTIENSDADVVVTATASNSYAGGICGYLNNSTIRNSSATGTITGKLFVGGITGRAITSANILQSYSTANVNSTNYAGGIVGYISNSSIIRNTYSSGNITRTSGSNASFGGFVGYCYATIQNSYSTASVYYTGASNPTTKGFAGSGSSYAVYNNNLFDANVSNQTSATGATGKTTADMKTQTTYTSATWDFVGEAGNGTNDYWGMNSTDNNGYPFLIWQGYEPDITPPSGSGTSGDPYLIATLDNLYWLGKNSDKWDKYYKQTADIDANQTASWFDGDGWYPIGNTSTEFTGSYNGQSYEINDLFILRSTDDNIGFFGIIGTEGNIIEVGLKDVNYTAQSYVGALAGKNKGSISKSYASGNATAVSEGGMLVGINETSGASISECYTNGSIICSGDNAGGITGINQGSITNSYSKTATEGVDAIGGFCGSNEGTIEKVYSTGSVTGTSNAGGLIGINTSTVSNSFWDTESSSMPTSQGGTGKTTLEMQDTTTFTDAGWDFKGESLNGTNDLWNIDGSNNEAYPWLSWQNYPQAWLGTTSSDWHDASNWANDQLPDANVSVIITTSSNNPVISTDVEVNDLSIESGTLTVAYNGTITINGDLDAGSNGLLVESNAMGTGSLICKGNVTGQATVQKFLEADNTYGWTVATPVTTASNDIFTGHINTYYYNPLTTVWTAFTSGNMEKMKGYYTKFSADKTLLFSDIINAGEISYTNFYRTGYQTGNYGWNFIGNPYTAAIDWDEVLLLNGDANFVLQTKLNAAVYVYDNNGSYNYYVDGSGTNGFEGIIPASTAFWVQVNSAHINASQEITGATLTLNSGVCVHESLSSKSLLNNTPTLLRVFIKAGAQKDETIIRLKDNATPDFDPLMDAVKMFSLNEITPQIYSFSSDDELLAINTLSKNNITDLYIPIAVKSKNNFLHSLSFDLSNVSENISWYLHDAQLDSITSISTATEYDYYPQDENETERFTLIAKTSLQAIETLDNACDANVYINNNMLNINICEPSVVKIYSITGQLLWTKEFNAGFFRTEMKLCNGIYILNLKSNSHYQNHKFIIK